MNKNFKYPDVFERNDYSAYTVANHFCEMLRNTLIKDASGDINIYNMIRNIIYYADDLGYTDTMLRYAKCELKVNETASYLDDFDIANTSNGVACTLLKIRNLDSREDARDIIDKAQSLLNKTEEILKTIYPNVYEVNINIDPEVDKMSAEELVLYFKELYKGCYSLFDERNEKIVYLMCMACYTVYYFYEMYISLGYGANYHHFIQSIGIGL